jgi:LysM repeat protein
MRDNPLRLGYWGLRPLFLLWMISVWVTACSNTDPLPPTASPTTIAASTLIIRHAATLTPSPTPGLPLRSTTRLSPSPASSPTPLIYTVQPGDTLNTIAARFGIALSVLQTANPYLAETPLSPRQRIIIPDAVNDRDGLPFQRTPTPIALTLSTPDCYETPDQAILCLGQINNQSARNLQRVIVQIQLLQTDGHVLRTQDAVVEQRLIPVGGSAPYHALFPAEAYPLAERISAVASVLLRAEDHQPAGLPRAIQTLPVEGDLVAADDQRYLIRAQVRNPGPEPVEDVRVVATLRDSAGRIAGYRVLEAGSLEAGAAIALDVLISSQVHSEGLTHSIYAEALRVWEGEGNAQGPPE